MSEEKQLGGRIVWIDIAKAIGMFLVIHNHFNMDYENNRLKIPCCDFIRLLGGQTIFREAADEGYNGQHNAIKYLIKINPSRAINI